MLKYRINAKNTDITESKINVENISFTNFDELVDNNNDKIEYNGPNKGKTMITCECSDIFNLKNNTFVNTHNTLELDYGDTIPYINTFVFDEKYEVTGVNEKNKSFSFYIDNEYVLRPSEIVRYIGTLDEFFYEGGDDRIFLYFDDLHYFDVTDYFDVNSAKQKIPIHFRYFTNEGKEKDTIITFRFYSQDCLVTSFEDFGYTEEEIDVSEDETNASEDETEKLELYKLIFGTSIKNDILYNWKYVSIIDGEEITKKEYDYLSEDEKLAYYLKFNTLYGSLGGIEIYRQNFLFGNKTYYEFGVDKIMASLNIPIVNTFETTLHQMELLKEHFVEAEKKKAINKISDLEKDIYYPCKVFKDNIENIVDVYTIKFNLHFREHRGDDWLLENDSFWNCVKLNNNKAEIVKLNNISLTTDNQSDLLTFLNFIDDDIYYQKNKLKKSFLRLLFYDSMNPGNQNLIGYSTIFVNSGELFTKYMKYMNKNDYVSIGADKDEFGKYIPVENKKGIRVDRDFFDVRNKFDEKFRMSSQFVVKDKNISKSSSEGFYLYIWKDNESPLPQDLYMKVEFNHAGYGRTIPFMMPYWDNKKWANKKGIKTFEEILNDWNEEQDTDGKYNIRKYTKFSYIRLKYQYDKDNDKHIYYIDPDIYGKVGDENSNELEINLYEAKVI